MADLRIFSYLPNPRVAKATIAARLVGVDIEVVGAAPSALKDWLWDVDARPLRAADRDDSANARVARKGFVGVLYKTERFLQANPYGNVPVAFSPDGRIGIFESNSMLRAVARLARSGPALYGADAYSAARIDGFLDVSLAFALDAQRYLFAVSGGTLDSRAQAQMHASLHTYLGGIETALETSSYLSGADLTLADICYAAEVTLFALVRSAADRIEAAGFEPLFDAALATSFPRALAHFHELLAHPSFAPDLGPYYHEMTLDRLF